MTKITPKLVLLCAILSLQIGSVSAQNPYLPLGEFVPDGEPYVFEDPDAPGKYRIYVYGSHDLLRSEYCGRNQVVWSAPVEQPTRWRYDGVCFSYESDVLYAPDIVEYKDGKGKKLYYYYPNNQAGGRQSMVSVSTRPDGPFKPCNLNPENPAQTVGVLGFDPAVFQDDDGRVYGYWGFEESFGAELDPATMATVKPGTQIVRSMVSSCRQDGEFRFFEASSMRKIKDKYVFIYSRKTAEGEFGLPSVNYTLAYAWADSPLGPFKYGGTLIDCRAREVTRSGQTVMTACPYGNTHGSIAKVGGQWYVFYHRQCGSDEFSRQAMVSPIEVEVVEGPGGYVRISEGEYNSEGFALEGLNPLERCPAGLACHYTNPGGVRQQYPNFHFSGSYPEPVRSDYEGVALPYGKSTNQCPVVNNTAGSVVGYKYFNFSVLDPEKEVRMDLEYIPEGVPGRMDIYLDEPGSGTPIGSLLFDGTDSGQVRTDGIVLAGIDGIRGKHALYFVFLSPVPGKSLCRLCEFVFSQDTPSSASARGLCDSSLRATVIVKDTVMVTYPFADPDPVPSPGRIYPYWSFRKFTTRPRDARWKMIVLENKYLRVKIFPEIGGKVWSVYDKTAHSELFYDNDVVKFREIAMRGPWSSGGIEFNYGVIGHAPTCSSPVDWDTAINEDGSASCYISATELLSRSRWTIEVNLPADAVYLRTSCLWHNASPEYQPFYHWANSAVKASDDLVLVYPADNAISHGGEVYEYPLDSTGNDFSLYRNQAYGADKSYHMIGSRKSFFGAHYPSEGRGVLHYSLRDEKLGRKYFSWAQSDQGNIWVDLLTDSRGQYVEMQSGKLFNQNFLYCSENSPYRQILFTPYSTERWSDYWMPYAGIDVPDQVNLSAVTSVSEKEGKTRFGIYSLRALSGVLLALDSEGKTIARKKISLSPAEAFTFTAAERPALLKLDKTVIWRNEDGHIDRPQTRNADFDPRSTSARLLMARDMIGMKYYRDAEALIDTVLAVEESNLEALGLKAGLLLRRMQYDGAYSYSDRALAVDQYDPYAGYVGALAADALGKIEDAMDRFEVAAIASSPLRTACFTELARIHYLRGDIETSAHYARKALKCNADNITSARILCLASGLDGDFVASIDPMDHFAAAVKYLGGEMSRDEFVADFKEEMAWQACLDLAVFFSGMGMKKEAADLLDAFPVQNVLTALWSAYLRDNASLLPKALSRSIDFVFPFRRESAPVLKWAIERGGGWKAEYLMSMLQANMGNTSQAASLLGRDDIRYAPYYAYRYSFTGDIADLQKAFSLGKDNWMYLWRYCSELTNRGLPGDAIALLEPFCAAHPDIIQSSDALVDAYIAAGRYADADKLISNIVYLPFEGQRGSHDKYKNIKLHLAREALERGDLDTASSFVRQARLWPAHLGVGKPYDNLIDSSAEDSLENEIEARRRAQ